MPRRVRLSEDAYGPVPTKRWKISETVCENFQPTPQEESKQQHASDSDITAASCASQLPDPSSSFESILGTPPKSASPTASLTSSSSREKKRFEIELRFLPLYDRLEGSDSAFRNEKVSCKLNYTAAKLLKKWCSANNVKKRHFELCLGQHLEAAVPAADQTIDTFGLILHCDNKHLWIRRKKPQDGAWVNGSLAQPSDETHQEDDLDVKYKTTQYQNQFLKDEGVTNSGTSQAGVAERCSGSVQEPIIIVDSEAEDVHPKIERENHEPEPQTARRTGSGSRCAGHIDKRVHKPKVHRLLEDADRYGTTAKHRRRNPPICDLESDELNDDDDPSAEESDRHDDNDEQSLTDEAPKRKVEADDTLSKVVQKELVDAKSPYTSLVSPHAGLAESLSYFSARRSILERRFEHMPPPDREGGTSYSIQQHNLAIVMVEERIAKKMSQEVEELRTLMHEELQKMRNQMQEELRKMRVQLRKEVAQEKMMTSHLVCPPQTPKLSPPS